MSSAPSLARRHGDHDTHGRSVLVIGGLALAALVLIGLALGLGPGFGAGESAPPPQASVIVRTADARIIRSSFGNQTTDPFYLAGGTYRSDWSAWGEPPAYPPCTHSAELMAVDPANAETPFGHVSDLGNLVHVPGTGASYTNYVYKVKPGEYYLDVNSECAWQIALSPT